MNEIKLYTIGFTKKTAEEFFKLLLSNKIGTVLDIRLNNTSQLSAFAKYPDIKFFLKEIANIEYIHDKNFAPDENTLKRYKRGEITWEEYKNEFIETMQDRNIYEYIKKNYHNANNFCLLCSEASPEKCHRTLMAEIFKEVLERIEVREL